MKVHQDRDGSIEIESSMTDPGFGCEPATRSIKDLLKIGMVSIDKPRGPSSHQVVSWLKQILDIEKAGHHGTLDPNTTGVLPIALGDGVKLLDTTLTEGKEYLALMHLHSKIPLATVKKILAEFTGEIYQMVPVRSAVRRGLRTRKVHYIKHLDSVDNDHMILIGCESGTYIRTIIHDMGEVMGSGGNMAELRRTRSGKVHEKQSHTLQELRDAWELYKENGNEELLRSIIRPAEELVSHLRSITMKDSAIGAICHGAPIAIPGISIVSEGIQKDELVSIMSLKGEVIGLAAADMTTIEMTKQRSGQAAHLRRVIMEPDTYPRAWKRKKAEK